MWSGRGTRKEFVIVAVLQVVSGAAGGVQLILVKNLLDAILSAGRAARGGADAVP